MHKVLSLLLLVIAYNFASAQVAIFNAGFAPRINDSTLIRCSAGFFFGSGANCPHVSGYDKWQSSDTIYLRPYYNLSGSWASFGCGSNDTSNLGKLSTSITAIRIQVYAWDSNSPPADTFFQGFDTTLLVALSVPNNLNKTQISISPNPVADELFIEHARGSSAEVYDIMGRLVYKNAVNSDKEPIDTKYWQQGMYMIRLSDDAGNRLSKKILKE